MSQTGEKKIALCFSGQPRTWRKCAQSWRDNLLRANTDVFCHLWTANTLPNAIAGGQPNIEPILQWEIDELFDLLRPVDYIIEEPREFTPMNPGQALTNSNYLSQFYGVHRAATLKKEWEIKHEFRYGGAVRMRYDTFLGAETHSKFKVDYDSMMNGIHMGWDHETKQARIGDIMWHSDSRTYDIIADFWLNSGTISGSRFGGDVPPERIFFHYLKKNGVKITPHHWKAQLMRYDSERSFSKVEDPHGFETW
jgi:hypothetical protein